jgi:hypothetical protein
VTAGSTDLSDFLRILRAVRSVREFRPDPLPGEVLAQTGSGGCDQE